MAEAIAAQFRTDLHVVRGIVKPEELISVFVNARPFDIVFIDEAHRLATAVQEIIFEVIDKHIVPDASQQQEKSTDSADSPNAPPHYRKVAPVGIILATDQPGMLLNALLKRMEAHDTSSPTTRSASSRRSPSSSPADWGSC